MPKVQHDSEVVKEGQQVITACAFIWREHEGKIEVLLPKRAETKRFLPGMFELPGGHIEYGENIVAGLKREIREELQVDVNIGDPFYVFDYPNLVKKSHSVEIEYFGRIPDGSNIVINPEDHSEFGWFTEEGVRTVVAENRKNVFELGGDGSEHKIDTELEAMYKGFCILRGDVLDTGDDA